MPRVNQDGVVKEMLAGINLTNTEFVGFRYADRSKGIVVGPNENESN